jgi:hypothetical protein
MGEYSWLPTVNHGDLNGDGYPELVIQGYHFPRDNIRILWNDGTGNFIDTNSVYVYQNEIELSQQTDVYPNPTFGKFTIRSTHEKIDVVKILDIDGRILLNHNMSNEVNSVNCDLKKLNIKPGIYLCLIQLENKVLIYKKLIINKPG